MTTSKEAIGARVRERREALGLTQVALAEKAGMRSTEISDVERGERGLTTDRLVALVTALDASADEILGIVKPQRGAKRSRRARSHA